jgi:hypothetical protein
MSFTFGAENQYIIYYSNYCINSKELMNILCKSPLYKQFVKINVSERGTRIPSFLKSVPTILVPKVNRPLVGEETFQWLEQQTEQRINTNNGITPYSSEMGFGFTETYSYLDVKDVDQPMEHTYVFLNKGDQKIETPPEESFVSTKPKAVQGVNMNNRPPFPQAPQRQQNVGNNTALIPQSSSSGEKGVEDAYNDLIARRKMDISPP